MRRSTKVHQIAASLACLFLFSCKKSETIIPTPSIELIGFEQIYNSDGKDSLGILHLSFKDGDGDLGLAPEDTFPPFNKSSNFYYNFFITYYELQMGQWVKVDPQAPFPGGDTVSNSSRIPFLTPDGQVKQLEGELFIELFTNNPFSSWDTIRYEASIVDRALNRSNQVQTRSIILTK